MRTRTITGALALVGVVISASLVWAQAGLPENHYKVYHSSPITIVKDIGLQDQFGSFTVTDLVFDRFSTPTEKHHSDGEVFPMFDPLIHMDWWHINVPQPERTIIGIDQFGASQWVVKDAQYLLLPSLKNVPPPAGPYTLPFWNHYVCYEAIAGPLVGQYVVLIDQFGTAQVQVLQAKYFCNPAQKTDDGAVYQIKDPIVHLACYLVQNPNPSAIPITSLDQFGYWQTQIYDNDCLCVPALKEHAVKSEPSTWGKVKALYRN